MIDVSELTYDPDFAQAFTILRSKGGSYLNGVLQWTTENIQMFGPISQAEPKHLKQIPEGDEVEGARIFWSAQPMYTTRGTQGVGAVSDIVMWAGLQWRIHSVDLYQDYGYYGAIASRMKPS